MGNDLMTPQIEINPVIGASPFGTAEQLAVETAGGGEIVNREGKVKGRKCHRAFVRACLFAVQTFG